MPWYDFIWDDQNAQHIAEHGVSIKEAQYVILNAVTLERSRATDRLVAIGQTQGGRRLFIAFDLVDLTTAYVVTAYDLHD